MNELGKRSLTAVIGAILVLAALFAGRLVLFSLIIIAGVAGSFELSRLEDESSKKGISTALLLWLTLSVLAPGILNLGIKTSNLPLEIIFKIFLAASIVSCFYNVLHTSSVLRSQRIMVYLFCLYFTIGLLLIWEIYIFPSGRYYLSAILFAVWSADIAAYLAGKKFGKHKVAPLLSPGKTWEGILTGLVVSTFTGSLVAASGMLPAAIALTLGVTAGTLGPAGDMIESKLKRYFKVKDTSGLLPGHGGILDRTDSLILVTYASYLFLKVRI